MMCSPYLTGSLAVMLVLVTFNYWSVSTNNYDLVKEVQNMQVQLKTGSGTIQEKDKETMNLKKEVLDLKEKLKKSQITMQEKLEASEDRQRECVKDADRSARKAREEKETLQKKVNDFDNEVDDLKKQISDLNKELENTKTALAQSQKEVQSLKADQVVSPAHVQSIIPPRHLGSHGLGVGQLGDVDPNVVSVVKKDTQGMVFHLDDTGQHYLPLLPRGDPNKPRAKPEHSVWELENRIKRNSLSGTGLKLEPLPGPSSSKPSGISSSKRPSLVDNVAGVMPPPNNLDQAEDDSHIPENENGPEGKKDLQDDDQDPDGEVDENVNLDSQHFLEDKAGESGLETKEVKVEELEDVNKSLDGIQDQDSFNTQKSET